MALRDGIAEWARTFFQEEDRVFKYPFLKRRTRSTSSWRLSLRDTPPYTLGSKGRATFLWYAVLGYFHLVRSIGLWSTSSRTPQSLQSPPVRGRPGGHDGNGRPLVAFLFTAQLVRSG